MGEVAGLAWRRRHNLVHVCHAMPGRVGWFVGRRNYGFKVLRFIVRGVLNEIFAMEINADEWW